jgi:hypothetical protein
VVLLYARMGRRRGHGGQALALVGRLLERSGPLPRGDEANLRFAAAELLDTSGRYDEAFAQAARGNALSAMPHDPAAVTRQFDELIEYFTPERLRCLPRAVYRREKPVFIVGMPRSGTSLLEQIVASHPAVHGAGELDFMPRVYRGTLDMLGAKAGEYPRCLDRLTIGSADGMAQIYLEPLNALAPEAQRIVDKMPLNFMHVGLIALLLPEARVIHCRRDPLDTCLSCYLTPFATPHPYKNDLAHLGSFYGDYRRLMAHWQAVVPLPMLEVNYEEVVADPEGQARRVIEFLGLSWDERCARAHEIRRPVGTASVQQVRAPVYRSSVQRWRNYEGRLEALKAALAGAI